MQGIQSKLLKMPFSHQLMKLSLQENATASMLTKEGRTQIKSLLSKNLRYAYCRYTMLRNGIKFDTNKFREIYKTYCESVHSGNFSSISTLLGPSISRIQDPKISKPLLTEIKNMKIHDMTVVKVPNTSDLKYYYYIQVNVRFDSLFTTAGRTIELRDYAVFESPFILPKFRLIGFNHSEKSEIGQSKENKSAKKRKRNKYSKKVMKV